DSGSLGSYFSVDNLIGKENRTSIHKLILLIRFMSRRNFYSLGFLFVAIIGGYFWVFVSLTIGLTCFLIHQIEDIIMIKRLRPSGYKE
ncbi:MAG: hypothetical protein ACRENZ_05430, partial [Thermodesulfobacteriota bacterium]